MEDDIRSPNTGFYVWGQKALELGMWTAMTKLVL